MSTKITLDLHDPRAVAVALRDAGKANGSPDVKATMRRLAKQIDAQLPEPIPPEPEGDAVVRDSALTLWRKHTGVGWWTRGGDGNLVEGMPWEHLVARGIDTIYRPEPSRERVEELVAGYVGRWADGGTQMPTLFREFAAALVGGDA